MIFWVGMPVASVLFGDVFAVLSPWRSCARAMRWAGRRRRAAPSSRGRRFATRRSSASGRRSRLIGFAWLELVYVERDSPSTLAALSLGYFLVMLAGMLLFGVEEWAERADGFGVYFDLLARMSALCPLRTASSTGAAPERAHGDADTPRTVALVCAVIGTTTFDGLSNDVVWRELEPHLRERLRRPRLHPTPAIELAYTVGLLMCVAPDPRRLRVRHHAACAASAAATARAS